MAKPMRLLLAISDLDGGGAQRQISLLAQNLSRKRFVIEICLWRDTGRYECPSDIRVHMIRKTRPWHVFRAIREFRELVDRTRPDLVFSQLHYVNMVIGTALAGSRHRPGWICRLSNDPRREMRGPFAFWARRALRNADRVIACSHGVARASIEHVNIEPTRVETLDNLADVIAIQRLAEEPLPIPRSPETFVVVHAGRLHHQKNQAMLLEAFSLLENRPSELWMLGEGELLGELQSLAGRLGIADRVRWLGFRENPYPFFNAANCFALSSDFEGLPNAVIEAMVCGTPVVSTRCPYGPEELIEDSVSGRLVPVGDVDGFTSAIESLAADPSRTEDMGAAARRQTFDRFTIDRTCRPYEDLFERVATPTRESAQG